MYIFNRIFKKLFSSSNREDVGIRLFKAFMAGLFLNFLFGSAFYLAESIQQPELNYWDSIWWAMVTMTTVGYGDYYAQTNIGRYLISYPCMLVGIGIIGYLISVVAESMISRLARFRRGDMTIKLENHIILCNCPSIEKILNLVQELKETSDFVDSDIVLITNEFDEIPDTLFNQGLKFVKGSSSDEKILIKAGIAKCSGVFVLNKSGEVQDKDVYILAVASVINMLKKELNCNPKVVVEISNRNSTKLLEFAGADGVVASEGISDRLMVQEFLYPGIHNIVQQIISNTVGSQFYIFETQLIGHKLKEVQMAVLQSPEDLQVIGVVKGTEQLINPSKEYKIAEGDKLIMLANSRGDFEALERDILQSRT